MKYCYLGLVLLWSCTSALAQDKQRFDLDFSPVPGQASAAETGASKTAAAGRRLHLDDAVSSLTLLPDGYFTIGTTEGRSASTLDDATSVTFGHPYALTSYPFFTLDGAEQRLESFFAPSAQELSARGDTLRLVAAGQGPLRLVFDMIRQDEGARVRLALTVVNTDTAPHTVGLGFLFDPALGRWGDGHALLGPLEEAQWVAVRTALSGDVPARVALWERAAAEPGMGASLDFPAAVPDSLLLGNWRDLHTGTPGAPTALYDLAVRMAWKGATLQPGEARQVLVDVVLLPPVFPDGLFLRADLPAFLSIEQNTLFPRTLAPLVALHNDGPAAVDATLTLDADVYVEASAPDTVLPVAPGGVAYTRAGLEVPELFEDQVVTLTLRAYAGGREVDRLVHDVLIPASPFSDAGLVVEIDSVLTPAFPRVDVRFRSRVEETGYLLTGLRPENVFLYENDRRIRSFTLEKDTTGGVSQVDVVFVLDVTGSMGDEINGVKNNIIEFADSLRGRGVDYRLGMVTFLDEIENVYSFTSSVQTFQGYVAAQYAHGGDDRPENSLDALVRAAQFDFRPGARRLVVWITDADYHVDDHITRQTPAQVVDALLAQGVTVHAIGAKQFQTDFYNPILNPTGGRFFDIYGNFRDILLEISRLPGTGGYVLSYASQAAAGAPASVAVEVHAAGLGGRAEAAFAAGKTATARTPVPAAGPPRLASYPNPFHEAVRIDLHDPQALGGTAEVFDVLGRRVRHLPFEAGRPAVQLRWDATDDAGRPVPAGLYVVRVRLHGNASGDGANAVLPAFTLVHLK